MDSAQSYGAYRNALHMANPPCIPFLCVKIHYLIIAYYANNERYSLGERI